MKSRTLMAMVVTFCLGSLYTSVASAQIGEHPNGGEGGETTFKSIRSKTFEWFGRNYLNTENMEKLHLSERGLTGPMLYERLKTVQNIPVRFVSYILTKDGNIPNTVPTSDRVEIVVNDKSIVRTCINHAVASQIEILCHEEAYAKKSGSEKYKLGFHEELGILGIEENKGIYSDYEISANLVNFWGPDENGTLFNSPHGGLDADAYGMDTINAGSKIKLLVDFDIEKDRTRIFNGGRDRTTEWVDGGKSSDSSVFRGLSVVYPDGTPTVTCTLSAFNQQGRPFHRNVHINKQDFVVDGVFDGYLSPLRVTNLENPARVDHTTFGAIIVSKGKSGNFFVISCVKTKGYYRPGGYTTIRTETPSIGEVKDALKGIVEITLSKAEEF